MLLAPKSDLTGQEVILKSLVFEIYGNPLVIVLLLEDRVDYGKVSLEGL